MAREFSEINSPENVFEHLFPGNRFQDLPSRSFKSSLISLLNLSVQKEWAITNFMLEAAATGERCIMVEKVDYTDQFWTQYFLRDIEPSDVTIHPFFYKVSFAEHIRKGEKLGGVGKRKLDWSQLPPVSILSLSLNSPNFGANKSETIIGVLDEKGKPSSLIHFIDEDKTRIKQEDVIIGRNLVPHGVTI